MSFGPREGFKNQKMLVENSNKRRIDFKKQRTNEKTRIIVENIDCLDVE